jgi:branched-subunit amino acid aminotransferase/4-amino-4-deoxychorismate lyase
MPQMFKRSRRGLARLIRSADTASSSAITVADFLSIPRELLYIADEVFFTGTAAEITPIRSVDRISVGNGKIGPITEILQQEFFAIVNGTGKDRFQWLTPVPVSKQVISG